MLFQACQAKDDAGPILRDWGQGWPWVVGGSALRLNQDLIFKWSWYVWF